jgi:hypothetical protein
MEKKYKRFLALTFIIFIFGIFFINTFKDNKSFSELENRNLTKEPKFKLDNLLDGRYTKRYEKYKNDQFVMKDSFLKLKSKSDRLLGKKDNNNIFLASDDYLIEGFKEPNEEDINKNIKAINDFTDKHNDISHYFMIIPNSVSIYKDKLPKNAPVKEQNDYINNFAEKISKDIKLINPYNTFMDKKDEQLYYRTDHHWTTKGAFYAYELLCENMNLKQKYIDDYDVEKVSNDFLGSLYSRSMFNVKNKDDIEVFIPKDKEDEVVVNYVEENKLSPTIYNSEKLNSNDKYGVFLGGNKPLIEISTTSRENKSILLIKDSYANSFVQFLTSNFKKIIMVDPRYFYGDIEDIIKNYEITDILYLYNANTFFNDTSLNSVLEN